MPTEKLPHPEYATLRPELEALNFDELMKLRVKIGQEALLINMQLDLIDSVIVDTYGIPPTGAYDANDGTLGSTEHPEDDQWAGIVRGTE